MVALRTVGLLSLLGTSSGLQCAQPRANSAAIGRRSAVAGILGLPLAASAAEFTGYKTRDYGNGENTATGEKPREASATSCPEGERLAPDGFGGKKSAEVTLEPAHSTIWWGGDLRPVAEACR